MDDMENNQDFDLEDILKEFGDHPESEEPSEPAGQMPELRFDDPETEEEPAASAETEEEPEVSAEVPVEQPLSDTLDFGPITPRCTSATGMSSQAHQLGETAPFAR